jgi:hypothetical protein
MLAPVIPERGKEPSRRPASQRTGPSFSLRLIYGSRAITPEKDMSRTGILGIVFVS